LNGNGKTLPSLTTNTAAVMSGASTPQPNMEEVRSQEPRTPVLLRLAAVDPEEALHHRAHEECYIANSVRAEIILRPKRLDQA
jgi:organic hydroperoxide reductase OsmC/OhrA